MVHWPEVMVTYDSKDKVLFSADAFGKFGALDVEEDWTCEARRYYFGIVGKYGVQAQALLKKAAGLDMDDMNYRERSFDEFLPWSHLDMGIDEGYLEMEWKRSVDEAYTPPCVQGCKRCGVCK